MEGESGEQIGDELDTREKAGGRTRTRFGAGLLTIWTMDFIGL